MAIAEKLTKKLGAVEEKLKEKAQKMAESAPKGEEKKIDSSEWTWLFLAAGFVEIIIIIITVIGIIPAVGQVAYPILMGCLNIIVSGSFFLFLYQKGYAQYWGLAFGGGVANMIPVLNWLGWIGCVLILYFLTKAEKVPLAGKAIEMAAKATSKIK